jgi:hypothetical protein
MDPVYLCVVSKSVFESSDHWQEVSTIVVHLSEAQVEPIKNRIGKLGDAMNQVSQIVSRATSESIEVKPPLGIQPRHLWIESRRDELYSAINRYREHMKHVPTGWLSELLELEREIQMNTTACSSDRIGPVVQRS